MKKIVGIAVVSASVFMLAGCSTEKEQKGKRLSHSRLQRKKET